MKEESTYPKLDFEPDKSYWKDLEARLLSIPSMAKPKVYPLKRYRWWVAVAVVALLVSVALLLPGRSSTGLTGREMVLYLENEGAWMIEDLAFDEEIRYASFDDIGSADDLLEVFYLQDIEDVESYWEIDI